MRYFDANGNEILRGMMIRIGDNDPEEVYACEEDNLGINGSSKNYLEKHPNAPRYCLLLQEFTQSIIEIVTR